MALAIYDQGERALPHGTCPGVGVGGHISHGGYGHASRLWGLALDTVVGLDVVLANGTEIHTDLTQYPDMYYALRGTADSFGIITTFYLQTKPAPQSVINFAVQIPSALDNVTIATDAFLKLQETVFNSSVVNSNLSFGIYTDNTGAFSLSGWCVQCDLGTFSNTTLPALLQGFPNPILHKCQLLTLD